MHAFLSPPPPNACNCQNWGRLKPGARDCNVCHPYAWQGPECLSISHLLTRQEAEPRLDPGHLCVCVCAAGTAPNSCPLAYLSTPFSTNFLNPHQACEACGVGINNGLCNRQFTLCTTAFLEPPQPLRFISAQC